jgi:hypothetical protein
LVQVAEQFGTRTLWVYKLEMGAPHAMTNEEKLRKPLSYDDAMAIRDQVPDAARFRWNCLRKWATWACRR